MRYLHALPAPMTLVIAALLLAVPAAARSTAQAAEKAAPASEHALEADNLTTGTVPTTKEKRQKRFEDCMAIWDRGTHMTKHEWRRTCRSQLDEFPNL